MTLSKVVGNLQGSGITRSRNWITWSSSKKKTKHPSNLTSRYYRYQQKQHFRNIFFKAPTILVSSRFFLDFWRLTTLEVRGRLLRKIGNFTKDYSPKKYQMTSWVQSIMSELMFFCLLDMGDGTPVSCVSFQRCVFLSSFGNLNHPEIGGCYNFE